MGEFTITFWGDENVTLNKDWIEYKRSLTDVVSGLTKTGFLNLSCTVTHLCNYTFLQGKHLHMQTQSDY